jgi:hypothetical protein
MALQGVKKCIICDEKENKGSHIIIGCPRCPFEGCRACYIGYFKAEGLCRCMDKANCGVEWNRRELTKVMTKSFMTKEYKEIQEKRVFDTEQALLPATMDVVKEEIESERRVQEIERVTNQIRDLERMKINLLLEHRNGGNYINAEKGKAVYVRACPEENCRGYLNTNWKCDLCEKITCRDCNVVLGMAIDCTHVCEEGAKATAALLAKDTKPCPKCSEGIFKIDGCDQMWCVKCHTPFSWKTGRIETRVHNPHYFQWMRDANNGVVPRTEGDVQANVNHVEDCVEGLLTQRVERQMARNSADVVNAVRGPQAASAILWGQQTDRHFIYETQRAMWFVTGAVQGIAHVNRVEAPRYRVEGQDVNRSLRVGYLREKLTKDEFKSKLFKKQKEVEKKREIEDALTLYTRVAVDIMNRAHAIVTRVPKPTNLQYDRTVILTKNNLIMYLDDMNGVMQEMVALEVYVNKLLGEISQVYGCKQKWLKVMTDSHTGLLSLSSNMQAYVT